MLDYMEDFRVNTLKYPDMVVLVPSNDLNPEDVYYYEDNRKSKSPIKVPERSFEEVN
jgi:hypothetical protein